MEREIPAWVLVLVIFIGINLMVVFGWSVSYVERGGKKLGSLGAVVIAIAESPSLVKQVFAETVDDRPMLIDNRFPEIDGFNKNSVLQDGAVRDDGYLLLSAYDNNKEQSTVKLIRISDQKILHEWIPDIHELAQQYTPMEDARKINSITTSRFRVGHPFILNDGSLVFHNFEGPLFNIDVCSNLKWVNNRHFHHSIEQDSDGNLWVPTVIESSSYDKDKFYNYRDDAIAKLSTDGTIIFKKSVSKILEENNYLGLLFGTGVYEEDALHLNDIQPANFTTKYWQKGDLLLSIRNLSTLLIYRPKTNKIIWLRTGPWLNQHDADFIGESKISVFGNDSIRDMANIPFKGHNQVYIYDLEKSIVTVPYSDMLKKLEVRSKNEGLQEILGNGDVFIEEQNYGRILRISQDKTIWEYTVKVDDNSLGMLHWSRYLTDERVKQILPTLVGSNCS